MPLITVAMAAYNDAAYIQEAIDSILNQTFTDFELLIINDGSTDETPKIIETYTDKRLRIINLEQNKGRPFVRNLAFDEACGKYLAWMDADDISPQDRLEVQSAYMEEHADIAVCGGYMQCFGNSDKLLRMKSSYEAAKAGIVWYCSNINGTNCMRLESIHKYNLRHHAELLRTQDYAFLGELLLTTPLRLVNLPRVFLNGRYFYRPSTPTYHVKAAKYILRALKLPEDELSCQKHTTLSLGMHKDIPLVNSEDLVQWANEVYAAVLNRKDIDMGQFLRVTHAKMEHFFKALPELQQTLRLYAATPLGKTQQLKKLFEI